MRHEKNHIAKNLDGILAAGLTLSAPPVRAVELLADACGVQLIQYRGHGGSCRGLRGWERDRCERVRTEAERRHDRRKHENNLKTGVAAVIIGLTIGAIIAAAAEDAERKRDARQNWIARCSARYPSFDARTGVFVGNDGRRYPCR